MTETQQPFVVGVRFCNVGKIYHFDAAQIPELKIGDPVVVETARGWQLGEVASLVNDSDAPFEGGLKSVERRATPRDLLNGSSGKAGSPRFWRPPASGPASSILSALKSLP